MVLVSYAALESVNFMNVVRTVTVQQLNHVLITNVFQLLLVVLAIDKLIVLASMDSHYSVVKQRKNARNVVKRMIMLTDRMSIILTAEI